MGIGRTPNHTCKICGKQYWACDTCDRKIGIEWRAAACTEEHYHLYFLVWDYDNPKANKALARQELIAAKADEWVTSPCRDKILEIIGEEEKKPEAVEKHGDLVDYTVVVDDWLRSEETQAEPKTEVAQVKTPSQNTYNNKQQYYKNNNRKNSDWKKR